MIQTAEQADVVAKLVSQVSSKKRKLKEHHDSIKYPNYKISRFYKISQL